LQGVRTFVITNVLTCVLTKQKTTGHVRWFFEEKLSPSFLLLIPQLEFPRLLELLVQLLQLLPQLLQLLLLQPP